MADTRHVPMTYDHEGEPVGVDSRDLLMVAREAASDGEVRAWFQCHNGQVVPLPHVVRHSPDGFEYGYEGSGPADLALSILTAVAGPDYAEFLYQQFKRQRIAPETGEVWTMKVQQVREWIVHACGPIRRCQDCGARLTKRDKADSLAYCARCSIKQ